MSGTAIFAFGRREAQVDDVIGMGHRGHGHAAAFDLGDPMGASTCAARGEGVAALTNGIGSSAVATTVNARPKADTTTNIGPNPMESHSVVTTNFKQAATVGAPHGDGSERPR